MEIKYVSQVNFDEIDNLSFDYFICAAGYESRCKHSYELCKDKINVKNKICFSFQDRQILSKKENDTFFKQNNFKIIAIQNEQIDWFVFFFQNLFDGITSEEILIFLDYSSMTSIMYGAILKYFNNCDKDYGVQIFFSYTHAKFTAAIKSNPLFFNHPIPLFDPIQSTDQRIALLVGLGYEEDKALGLYEYFQNDSEDLYLFLTQNNKFYNEVVKSNEHILNITNPNNIIRYDLENLSPLINTLDSLVNYLINNNYRVVLAPIGPKIFNMISLVINLYHKNITTYRLSDGNKGNPIEKIADESKYPTILHVNLKSNIYP